MDEVKLSEEEVVEMEDLARMDAEEADYQAWMDEEEELERLFTFQQMMHPGFIEIWDRIAKCATFTQQVEAAMLKEQLSWITTDVLPPNFREAEKK